LLWFGSLLRLDFFHTSVVVTRDAYAQGFELICDGHWAIDTHTPQRYIAESYGSRFDRMWFWLCGWLWIALADDSAVL
jgi:hypothetical protein